MWKHEEYFSKIIRAINCDFQRFFLRARTWRHIQGLFEGYVSRTMRNIDLDILRMYLKGTHFFKEKCGFLGIFSRTFRGTTGILRAIRAINGNFQRLFLSAVRAMNVDM